MTLRISDTSLAFAIADKTAVKGVAYETYTVRSGISIAANLREAFRQSQLLSHPTGRAQVMLSAPTMIVPVEEFDQANTEVICSVLPQLNAVAIMAINRDLKAVIDDHYADVIYMPVEQPVWSYMHRRAETHLCRRLYAYFHDGCVSIFAFDKHRFRFCNTYSATRAQDSVYYMLYVWQQLQMDADKDELYIAGAPVDSDEMMTSLHRYLRKAYTMSPSAEFNRAPITEIKGIALDVVTLYMRGR